MLVVRRDRLVKAFTDRYPDLDPTPGNLAAVTGLAWKTAKRALRGQRISDHTAEVLLDHFRDPGMIDFSGGIYGREPPTPFGLQLMSAYLEPFMRQAGLC